MNIQEYDILDSLFDTSYVTQRVLSENTGYSLGLVNRSVKALQQNGFIDERLKPTLKAVQEMQEKAPRNAVILAAGFGMRMVPINMETPKGLLEVNGEPLIERLIRQLREAGIEEIHIVVGFMKEYYEYLIDEYGVDLIVNAEYLAKNNLHSLKLALESLSNTYILPCDLWCAENPFRRREWYAWYMVSDEIDGESDVRVNRKRELVSLTEKSGGAINGNDGKRNDISRNAKNENTLMGNKMIGICYLPEEQASIVRERIRQMSRDSRYDAAFWEEALYRKDRMIVPARVVRAETVVEINTYEQLRELDGHSNQLKSDAIEVIAKALHARPEDVRDISVLKKGMTNRSFLFQCGEKRCIMRIPGEGTDRLINRAEEAAVYRALEGKDLCDEVVLIDPENGYKITEYLEGARVCDPKKEADLKQCMEKLREFHEMGLTVAHEFDLFRQIAFYESLWEGRPSVFKDYERTKENVYSLRPYIEAHAERKVLTHIDAVPDNFLFVKDETGKEKVRLIDWEYAGMQDPHVDLAMFCIYALYRKEEVDRLIDLYFVEGCPEETRTKTYCYLAVCGLLWSNWCEYKRSLGVEFGEYSLRQYRYAKDYYRIAWERIQQNAIPYQEKGVLQRKHEK